MSTILSYPDDIHLAGDAKNFFASVKALMAENKLSSLESTGSHRFHAAEHELIKAIEAKQAAVHLALCDSINTPQAMTEIMSLVSKTNVYMSAGRKSINMGIVEKV